MKTPDMSKFIGSGFDCEFRNKLDVKFYKDELKETTVRSPWPYKTIMGQVFYSCRPRLNKPQVLYDWSWVEGLDGFVWDCLWYDQDRGHELMSVHLNSKECAGISKNKVPFALAFIGVEKGSGLEPWAKSKNVPIIDMEDV